MFLAQLGAEVIKIEPRQGGDTDALPAEAGVDAAEIARLRAARIV